MQIQYWRSYAAAFVVANVLTGFGTEWDSTLAPEAA